MRIFIVLALFFIGFCQFKTHASARDLPEDVLINDEETEFLIQEILEKIFKAMNVKLIPQVYLLSSNEINAAATYGGRIIVYTGLIIRCKHLGHLIAVLAHEAGHIAGGHLARMDEALDRAMIPSFATTLIGGIAALASGSFEPLLAGALGGAQMLERGIKKHTRGEEENADRAALEVLGEHAIWHEEFLNIIDSQTFSNVSEYLSTHPGVPTRIRAVRDFIAAYHKKKCAFEIPKHMHKRFLLIQKKILAFTRKPQLAGAEFPASDLSEANCYGRTIYLYRLGKTAQALETISSLIQSNSENPYYKEIKAQILFEQGRIKEAIKFYRQAIQYRPRSKYLKTLLAQAILEQSHIEKKEMEETLKCLHEALDKNYQDVGLWRLLAKAYGKDNQINEASACLAEEAWLLEDTKLAKAKAKQGVKSSNKILMQRSRDILEQVKESDKN